MSSIQALGQLVTITFASFFAETLLLEQDLCFNLFVSFFDSNIVLVVCIEDTVLNLS